MTPAARGYVAGAAGGEDTMRANREAFDRWRLLPRMLREALRLRVAAAFLAEARRCVWVWVAI